MTHFFPRPFDIIYFSLTLFHIQDKQAFIEKMAGLAQVCFVASVPKDKIPAIHCGSRIAELFPDDLTTLSAMLVAASFSTPHIIEVDFTHILIAEKQYAVNN